MRLFFIILLLLSLRMPVFADYALPYPSFMPGHKLYKVSRLLDELKKYWYWGEIASSKYHLALSDKYLIEAKTLFEYKQYPLALDALSRSDREFQKIASASSQAKEAHILLITNLLTDLPITFIWQDERRPPIMLELHAALGRSLEIRNE